MNPAVQAFIENNQDWVATCAIYGEQETQIQPLKNGGFCSSLTIPIPTSNMAFAYNCSDKEDHYRVYTIENPPVLCLAFDYVFDTESVSENEEYDQSFVTPHRVVLSWKNYPKEWPNKEEEKLLHWLQERSVELLKEQQMSFAVCEFCEHETLSYWNAFAKDFHSPYQLFLLPPNKIDWYKYHHHVKYGTEVHVMQDRVKARGKEQAKSAVDFARKMLCKNWKRLIKKTCPICFDTMPCSQGVLLPCDHFLCEDCFHSYLHFKVSEIEAHRTNPFVCPEEDCRKKMPIPKFVKGYLSDEHWKTVQKWKKYLKYPPCHSLDRCLSKACGSRNSLLHTSEHSTIVYCERCSKIWCELCLKRVPKGDLPKHHEFCDGGAVTMKFCKRYLRASDTLKEKCQDKYPWIVSYAHFRQSDGEALAWILQNGQRCPTCQTGVERSEGCFHMKCPNCATHFCYECGEQIFPPYYGTHHCWERTEVLERNEPQNEENYAFHYQEEEYLNDPYYWEEQNGILFGRI